MATKILVSGDVEGHFDALFTRIGKVHASKAGPFHALLCVGSFFGRKGAGELREYVQGQKQVPLPTYFICGDEFDTSLVDSLPNGGQIAPNLHYLGRSGVQTLHLGAAGAFSLTVAYLSGHYDQSSYFNGGAAAEHGGERNVRYQPHYVESDVISALAAGLAAPHIDLLLTCEWGRGWQMLLPPEKMPASLVGAPHASSSGSPVVAKLASQLPARYHFAGMQDCYLELAPYRNRQFVTRFVALGKAVSAKKEKGLYACNVSPFAALDKTTLPADVTACPYTVGSKPAAGAAGAASVAGHVRHADDSQHPFPADASPHKRQRVDEGGAQGGAQGQARFDPRFMSSMSAYDAASAGSNGAMRWDFKKPERGPPPPNYVCRICQEVTHWIDQCPQKKPRGPPGEDRPLPEGYVCRKCNQPGHRIQFCPLVLAEEAERAARGPAGERGEYVCHKCGQKGHAIRQCPLILEEEQHGRPPATYVCKKCNAAGEHFIRSCPLVLAENEARAALAATSGIPINKLPPPDYVCKVCNVKGHFVRDCPIVLKENAERRSAPLLTGAAGPQPGSNLDANGMPVGTKEDCWFCLATEHVSTHLILSVGSETYLALAKGCLTEEHVLILPIVHVSSSLDLSPEQRAEVDKYKLALRRYYRSKGQECLMYERWIPTRAAQHMHIQIVPLTQAQARAARQMLLSEAAKLDPTLLFAPMVEGVTLAQANRDRTPFILFELPTFEQGSGADASAAAAAASPSSSSSLSSALLAPASSFPHDRLIHFVNPRHKILGLFDFPRAVVAAMVGRPERSDWRKVNMTEGEETDIVEKMKETFMPFDFTMEVPPEEVEGAAAAAGAGAGAETGAAAEKQEEERKEEAAASATAAAAPPAAAEPTGVQPMTLE